MLAIIRCFLEFIMRGRKQATLIAVLFVFIPLFGWVSNVIIALVALRKGILEGFLILLWTALAGVILTGPESPKILYINILGGHVLTWFLAVVLRITVSWRIALLAAITLGVIVVCITHLIIPDMPAWWMAKLQIAATQASKAGVLNVSVPMALAAFKPIMPFLTGIGMAALLLLALSNVLVARWSQSILYNPGGLKKELYQLRLNSLSAMGLLVLTTILFFNNSLALDCLPVIVLPLTLIGLAVIHVLLANCRHSVLWLVVFYGLLILLFQPVAIILAMVAVLDGLIDIRKRLKGVE